MERNTAFHRFLEELGGGTSWLPVHTHYAAPTRWQAHSKKQKYISEQNRQDPYPVRLTYTLTNSGLGILIPHTTGEEKLWSGGQRTNTYCAHALYEAPHFPSDPLAPIDLQTKHTILGELLENSDLLPALDPKYISYIMDYSQQSIKIETIEILRIFKLGQSGHIKDIQQIFLE